MDIVRGARRRGDADGSVETRRPRRYNTVEEHPFKASTFILYPSFHEAGTATAALKRGGSCAAIEVFDRAALHEAEKDAKMVDLVPGLAGCNKPCAGLLVECRGSTTEELEANMADALATLEASGVPVVGPDRDHCAKPESLAMFPFRRETSEAQVFWDMRKGLIPMVGAQRTRGTSMLIEDVACEVDKLADMSVDLIDMFERHGYADASVFGHAMEGNMHLVFSQGFRNADDVDQFAKMMQEMCEIVAIKYQGSLKGEHGTGRNVSAFVEMEWGSKAYALMWRLKALFDPDFLLNPGVLLNHDPHVHKKNLKPSPLAHDLVDACIECGFCESNCPSRDAALTPRQRITTWREINRLARLDLEMKLDADDKARLAAMRKEYEYVGLDMCAADGMCQEKCPVKINTGELVKTIREEKLRTASPLANKAAMAVVDNFKYFDKVVPPVLNLVSFAHSIVGTAVVEPIAKGVHAVGGSMIPLWNPFFFAARIFFRRRRGRDADVPRAQVAATPRPYDADMPRETPRGDAAAATWIVRRGRSAANARPFRYLPAGAKALPELPPKPEVTETVKPGAFASKVVYMPSCVTRVMGPAPSDPEQASVPERFLSLMEKAGVEVIYPDEVREQCCGIMYHSRGCVDASDASMAKLEAKLLEASDQGKIPIVCDTSPCLKHVKDHVRDPLLKFALYEPVEFVATFLRDKLDFEKKKQSVAIHVPCSSKKMKLEAQFDALVRKCADDVHSSGVPCCGMAGDRGLRLPELTGAALQHLDLPADVTDAYSTSRTCECSLSNQSDVHFRSVLHLLDDCAKPRAKAGSAAK